jgi:hypothetical protein
MTIETPETEGEPGRLPTEPEGVPAAHPEGLPEFTDSPAPLGRFEAGEPLYVVVNKAGEHLSHHLTADGAEAILASLPEAVGIDVSELHP